MRNTISFQKELLQTIAWQIQPSYARQVRQQIMQNKLDGVAIELLENNAERQFFMCRKSGEKSFQKLVVEEDAPVLAGYGEIEDTDDVINVINIDGPITRNGGACSYGSKEIRDILIEASKMPNCIGHIFMLNSPGGSAASAYDYEQGIDAVKSQGQFCIGLIDNLCASACTRLSAKLDEVYYVHPNNQIGCIGTMAVFETNKDGDENAITKEVYHEIYADASTDKNGEFRQVAEGNDEGIKAILNKENDLFLEEMRRCRPNCTEEILSGKMFDCKDMEGILVDGQLTFEGCVERILELSGKCKPKCELNINEPAEVPAPVPAPNENTNSKTINSMNFENIESIIGEVETTEEGFFMNQELAITMNDKIGEMNSRISEADENLKSLDETKQSLESKTAELEEANKMLAEKTAELNEANKLLAEKAAELEEVSNKLSALEEANQSLDAKVNELNEALTSKDEVIASKDKEIEALSHEAPVESLPASATAQGNENDGAERKMFANISEMENLTAEQRNELFKERSKKLGILV